MAVEIYEDEDDCEMDAEPRICMLSEYVRALYSGQIDRSDTIMLVNHMETLGSPQPFLEINEWVPGDMEMPLVYITARDPDGLA